jgi:tyrosyl-tRNA synthetase
VKLVSTPTRRKLCSSSSEARRLIKQGGVYIDNQKVEDENLQIETKGEKLIKVGKRKFLRVLGE